MITLTVCAMCAGLPAYAGEPLKELAPRTVSLSGDKIALADALQKLHTATGNVVVDRRAHAPGIELNLNLRDVTFWQALDQIAEQAKCGYSLYQPDGKVALVDVVRPKTQVFYHGIFRLAVKRFTVTRDLDSGVHFCTLAAEIAWEPRFRAIYLEVGPAEITFAAGAAGKALKAKIGERGQVNVSDKHATEIELRFPAPPRQVATIASLAGTFSLMGPSKMHTFTFDKLPPKTKLTQTIDDVKVEITTPTFKVNPWTFGVAIHNPPGPTFESFQASDWLVYNAMSLVKKGESTVQAADYAILPSSGYRHASLEYMFTQKLPANVNGWSLIYRTPGRLVDISVPYTLKDIPLP